MSQKGWRTFLCVASDLCSDFHMASAGGSQHQKGEKETVRILLFLMECPFSAVLEHLKFLFGAMNILLLDPKELIDG